MALSYVAAQRTMFEYNDMADAKAMLESIARSFGYIYGREKRVRVNTISQSPTVTTAGSGIKGFDSLVILQNGCPRWEMPRQTSVRIIVLPCSLT